MKVATYTQAGSKKQVCTECEEEQTVTLEALEYTADATVEAGESMDYSALVAVVNGETAKEDNTFTDLYEEGYDFYETPAAADAE